ncbi:OsmC family protein [Lentzea sp. NEAU-D7]|uniref:OsmC family protein n=1 Tax=Lentzea sp. NEAU-D7 TaxID=2994667 RepID=UPI00224A7A3D|nr:OsmC family protein [Lentzea sp. NEAU-D7]MCX2951439.1 OsmC family protein [Lentzea sp. NEAU-D7]
MKTEVPLHQRVQVRHVQGDEYAVLLRAHEVHTDQPGSDQGMSPVELFAASLATCVAHYAGSYLHRHSLPREGLTVVAEYGMAADRPPRIGRIRITVDPAQALEPRRRQALQAVVDHCTVHNTLRQPPEIEIRVHDDRP